MNTLHKATFVRATTVLWLVVAFMVITGAFFTWAAVAGGLAIRVSAPIQESDHTESLSSTEYYVNIKKGNDNNPGTLALPFKTVNKAVAVVVPGDVVFLQQGTYRENIVMNKSGTSDAPITFRAYGDERVTISGAVEVGGWSDDDKDGIYEAVVPAPIDLEAESYQVFVDGKMVPQAREPEFGDPLLPTMFSQRWLGTLMQKAVAVHLQVANGQWVRVENGGGGNIYADAAHPVLVDELYLIDMNGGTLKSGDVVGFATSSHMHYLSANIGGYGNPNDVVVANRTELGQWEKFIIGSTPGGGSTIQSGDKVTFRAHGERFLSADQCGGGKILAYSESPGDCGKFTIVIQGAAVNIQAENGKYVRAVNGGGGVVLSDGMKDQWGNPFPDAEFSIIDTNGGVLESGDLVGFLTQDRAHYLAANIGGYGNPNDVVVADRAELGQWEKFTIETIPPVSGQIIGSGDQVAFKAFGGRYLSADQCGGGKIYANSVLPGDCGKFTITIHPDPVIIYNENDQTVGDGDGDGKPDLGDINKLADTWAGSYLWGPFGNKWSLNMAKIIASTPGKLTLGDVDVRWNMEDMRNGHIALIGGLAALDTTNEWHYDRNNGKLYFRPMGGVNPKDLNIEIRQRTWTVQIKGDYIVFRNIEIFGGQMWLEGNHNILDQLKFSYGTHYLYRTSVGAHNDFEIGKNGIYLKGNDNLVQHSEIAYSAGNGITIEGDRNEVYNCLVHDYGYMGTTTSGVYFKGKNQLAKDENGMPIEDPEVLMSTGSKLTYSTLFNSGGHGLDLSACRGCTITYNLLHDSTILIDDSGPIYSWGRDLGVQKEAGSVLPTEIAYNWIQGNTDPDRPLTMFHLGIYLDNSTRNAYVHHNVITGIGKEPGVGANTPNQGHRIVNNTIIHDRFVPPTGGQDPNLCGYTPWRPKTTGECAAFSCEADQKPEYGDSYFQGVLVKNPEAFSWATNACSIQVYECGYLPSKPIDSNPVDCNKKKFTGANPNWDYWMQYYLDESNTLDFTSLGAAQGDLNNPQQQVTTENGWEIYGNPDFRPKADTPLGAYKYNGSNWIPGYRPVVRSGQTTRISVDSTGAQGNNYSGNPSISADGRYVAFESGSSNLVLFDTRLCKVSDLDVNCQDIFLHDRLTRSTTRVSVDSGGNQANGRSFNPDISADGRYIAFWSEASNLVSGDTNDADDVFVHDNETGETTRVSVNSNGIQGNSTSWDPAISADGRFVVFWSMASNLANEADTNDTWDVFFHDRVEGSTTRVSVDSAGNQGNDSSSDSDISADGRFVVFGSRASNLVSNDTNRSHDIFTHDMQTGQTICVSMSSNPEPVEANSGSYHPSISADGRYVVFDSYANNLAIDDDNSAYDIFIHDTNLGKTSLLSLRSRNDANEGNGDSEWPAISADGRYVVFQSMAESLVGDDTQMCTDYYEEWNCSDIFIHDTVLGDTTLVSVNSAGNKSNKDSGGEVISADGRFIAFSSWGDNLVKDDTNSTGDVFVHARQPSNIQPPPPTPSPTAGPNPTPTSTVKPPEFRLMLPIISAGATNSR